MKKDSKKIDSLDSVDIPDFIKEHQQKRNREQKLAEIASLKHQKKVDSVLTFFIATFIIITTILLLLSIASDNYKKMYDACDNAKGYQCSYYEARLYELKGR